MPISYNQLNSFARDVVDRYNENTKLGEITNLEDYNEDQHQRRDFIQIGKRSNLPKDIFYEERATDTVMISSQFAKAIIIAEQKYILSYIQESVDDGTLDSYEADEFTFESIITPSFDTVYNPDYIFLPNDVRYRKSLLNWREDGFVKNRGDGQYIAGAGDIKVEWMPSNWGFENAFLFNSQDISVVQKRYKDAEYPEGIDPVREFDGSEEDDRLMVYLGKEFPEEPDQFEFFVRTVISEPRFTGFSPYPAAEIELIGDAAPDFDD